MDKLSTRLNQEDMLWVIGSLCQLHRKPFDPKLISQQFPPPYDIAALKQATRALEFETEIHEQNCALADDTAFPCIAFLINKNEVSAESVTEESNQEESEETTESVPEVPSPTISVLVIRKDEERIMYFKAGEQTPLTVELDEFKEQVQDFYINVKSKEDPVEDDEINPEKQPFGFRWFIPELLRHKKIWRDVVLASFAISLMGLAMPLFTQVVIDKVIVHHTMNTLIVIGFGLLMFMVFTAIMTWIRQYLIIHTGNRVDAILGSRVFSHLFSLPMKYFESRPTGTLIARVQGIETIRAFITGAAVTLILDFPFLFIFLGIMFYYSWQLTVIVLTILTLIAIVSLSITPLLRERLNEQFKLGARNQAYLIEYVGGMETVKSLQMEPQVNNRYGDYLSSYLAANFKTQRLSNSYNVSANTLEQIQTLAVLTVGAWLVMTTDSFTIGMLVAFQMFASRLSQPVLRMVGLWQEFQQANIAVKRLGDIMDAPAEPYSVSPSRAPGGEGSIQIKNLSFRYNEERPVLFKDFNLQVHPGHCVSIMGASGSGKSTLTKLLQGFYLPTEGNILIDNRNILHLSANELRDYFGVVPQETTLFSGTLYDNLIMANPTASFEQVIQACQMAEIHEQIEEMPQGYQTEIGENGVGLSGGQKQRIAIARAILKRPKILVFDEATSNLDQPTSEAFAKTINKLKGKVTILFITHQLPKGLKVDDAVILGKQKEEILQDKIKDEEA